MAAQKSPRYPKGIDAKKNIFKVSIQLINSKGYNETTIKDICKAADIGTGTFYHYFKSKQDLLIEYVKAESEDVVNYYNSLPDISYFENLMSIVEYQLDYIDLKGREFVRNVFAVELMNDFSLLGTYNYTAYALVKDCLSKGQAAMEFSSSHSVEFMADMIVYSIVGYVQNWIKYSDKSIKEYCMENVTKLIELFRIQ